MAVEVVTPEGFVGEVIGDLNARRGKILGLDSRGQARIVASQAPMAEIFGYATGVRSLTQGRANYSMEFFRYGEMLEGNDIDLDHYNASGQFVALRPGASFFDSVTSFEMARGGRIDTVILGAYEVDQSGSVANWSTADAKRGGIGGAMDLLSGKGDLIIVMEHSDSKGRPKLKKQCTYPLTGKGCVSYVVTDLALLRWHDGRFVLDEGGVEDPDGSVGFCCDRSALPGGVRDEDRCDHRDGGVTSCDDCTAATLVAAVAISPGLVAA
jgi:3-oxoacid CoA-transferase B subunit